MLSGVFLFISACALKPGAGPSTRAVLQTSDTPVVNADIRVVELTEPVALQVIRATQTSLFADSLGDGRPVGSIVGKGDVLDITIWEAPPAALFGTGGGDPRFSSSNATARNTSLPEQMVDVDGTILIPFAGKVPAAGRTPDQIGAEITRRLVGKAHQPQVIVRLLRNVTTNVTVVGEVASSARIPLTARGERLLDVLASVGGVRQPVGKTTIQITRGDKIAAMPLDAILADPRQNIRLQPDDVVTALFQSFSFTALGATGANAEVPFEATGITLAQALGRVGGLQDARADIKGVFLFRLEDPLALDPATRAAARQTPDGKVPVIYRIDMSDPGTFFVAQGFPIRNRDVLYVSNAPLADFQKFVNIVSGLVFPIISIENAASN
jgi:polysaccharide export outer membrane protein